MGASVSNGNVPGYIVKAGVTYRIISDPLGSTKLIVNFVHNAVGLYDPDTGLTLRGGGIMMPKPDTARRRVRFSLRVEKQTFMGMH